MIEILVPSDYRSIKGKSERLVYICLWAWLNLSWRKWFYDMARRFNLRYLGKRKYVTYTGEVVRVETWWDETARRLERLIVLNLAFYPHVEHTYEKKQVFENDYLQIEYPVDNPSGFLKEKEFRKTFGLKRTTLIAALKKLEGKKFIVMQTYMPEKRKAFHGSLLKKIKNFEKLLRSTYQNVYRCIVSDEDLDYYLEAWSKDFLGFQLNINRRGPKRRYYNYETTGRLARTWEFKKPLKNIEQVPLHILRRHDLSIAERLIGIESYRLKREKRDVKIRDLVKEAGFSKVTVIKALQKL